MGKGILFFLYRNSQVLRVLRRIDSLNQHQKIMCTVHVTAQQAGIQHIGAFSLRVFFGSCFVALFRKSINEQALGTVLIGEWEGNAPRQLCRNLDANYRTRLLDNPLS